MLRLQGKSCVIVGGGRVAARKLIVLHTTGAQLTVISLQFCDAFTPYLTDPKIAFWHEPYTSERLIALHPLLVFAATNDPAVNQQIVEDAHRVGALVDRADEAVNSDFYSMAAVQRGSLTFAVSSDGASPALTRHACERIENIFGDEYAVFSTWLERLRPLIREHVTTQAERAAIWEKLINSEILTLLRNGKASEARVLAAQITGVSGSRF